MKRKVSTKLIAWKKAENRKPLILWGARQVGKTWALQEFGRNEFDNCVYISMYNNSRIASIFEQDYDISRIINALEIELHVKIEKEKTLIIFDEVQSAPKIVESLKYFCEEGGEYCVAAAGSLLGVSIHEGVSFPVGKVDEIRLYPMDFEEFLWAMGEERLAGYIADYDNDEINAFRESYIEYLKQYFIVGGMPEAVESFRINKDFLAVRNIQNMILSQYEGDFGKHVKANELPRIRMVWNSLPAQLAKENKKFFFGNIKKRARSKDYEIALQWLKDAGLIHIVNKVSKPAVPLKSYMDPTAFKVFMNDIGLLGALSELEPDAYISSDLFVEFKGAMTEQYVLQELVAQESFSLYYFTTEKQTYEVDFLFQKDGNIVPLEVKSGENLKAKSLKFFYEKYMPDVAVRTSLSDMRRQDWLINVPLWAVKSLAVTKKPIIST